MKGTFRFLAIMLICLVFFGCSANDGENMNYKKGIVNDGQYVEVDTGNEKASQTSYPALNELLASIEDEERRELVTFVLYTPTGLEFRVEDTKVIVPEDHEQAMEERYIRLFETAESLIQTPIAELRLQAEEAAEKFEKLRNGN